MFCLLVLAFLHMETSALVGCCGGSAVYMFFFPLDWDGFYRAFGGFHSDVKGPACFWEFKTFASVQSVL